ncbi:MAG TPA: hypothetical protein V6D37_08570 [Candidatus Sericytochromatia bacterium]
MSRLVVPTYSWYRRNLSPAECVCWRCQRREVGVMNFDSKWSTANSWAGFCCWIIGIFQVNPLAKRLPFGSIALIPTASVFEYILKKKEQSQNLWTFSNLINSAG